jgi:hypothetical protein
MGDRRWYLWANGETSGPVDELQILEWYRDGKLVRGTQAQSESGGPWIAVNLVPAVARRRRGYRWLFSIAALAIGAMVFGGSVQSAVKSALRGPCVLRGPEADKRIPIFSTEEGLDEWEATSSAQARGLAFMAYHPLLVDTGTRCTVIAQGRLHAKVRITAGPWRESVGFTSNEWVSD